MELRQLRYFVRVVEQGSMSRAALDLDVVQSALSQQITRLESELATRLLQRTPRGVTHTEAGLAFFREAQLTLRHADQAVRAAQQARLSGTVTVGLAPTTSGVLGLPLMQAMRTRYPDVRLHMVESMSGHLTAMLNARQLDLAVLFDSRIQASQTLRSARRWSLLPLLEELLAETGTAWADVTAGAGISFSHTTGAVGKKLLPETMGAGVAVLDIDNDGFQDLFLVNSCPWPDHAGAARRG